MSTALNEALDAVRQLPPSEQEAIARAVLRLLGRETDDAVELTPDEQQAIRRSKDAAARGDFAADAEVDAVWAKHGL